MKLWRKQNEWQNYAACVDSPGHTLPPDRGEEDADKPVADPDGVRRVCASCRVRPECIKWALGSDQPVDVWVAGRFIPVDKRGARKIREELAVSLKDEFELRGEDV